MCNRKEVESLSNTVTAYDELIFSVVRLLFPLKFVFFAFCVCLFIWFVFFSLVFHFSRLAQRIFAILCAHCKHFDLFTCMIDAVPSYTQTHRRKMRASRMCQRRVHSKQLRENESKKMAHNINKQAINGLCVPASACFWCNFGWDMWLRCRLWLKLNAWK